MSIKSESKEGHPTYADALRSRNAFRTNDSILAGQLVDIAFGRVLRSFVDLQLSGVLPFGFERHYASSWSGRNSVFGYGWSHSFDQALWVEQGKIIYRDEEGREIEFQKDETPRIEIFEPFNRLLLEQLDEQCFRIKTCTGGEVEFQSLIDNAGPLWGRISSLRTRDNQYTLRFEYNESSLLSDIIDNTGRTIHLTYDAKRRVEGLYAPHPSQQKSQQLHAKYVYSDEGDLVEAHDSLGNVAYYKYENHLLREETDRTGRTTYWEYDEKGPNARCVRLWSKGNFNHQQISYDLTQRITVVTNSLGHSTTYQMNDLGAVTKIGDALGAQTLFEYNSFGWKTAETDPEGNKICYSYDARGNCIKIIKPDGAVLEISYNSFNQPVQITDLAGGKWKLAYDDSGRLLSLKNPLGKLTQYEYTEALLSKVTYPSGKELTIEYDKQKNISRVRFADGSDLRYSYDLLGRVFQLRDIRGNVQRYYYDSAHRLIRLEHPTGNVQTLNYDQEGYLVESQDYFHHRRFSYTGDHSLSAYEEAHEQIKLRYNSEGYLEEIINENGLPYRLERDPCNRVLKEQGFGGQAWEFTRDSQGRVIKAQAPDGQTSEYRYNSSGMLVEIQCSDGTFSRFSYRADGALLEAQNQHTTIRFERDLLGRITKEHQGNHWVGYTYDEQGNLTSVFSSLGADLSYRRAPLGEVERITARSGLHKWYVVFERDISGLEVERHLPGGLFVHLDRDQLGRPQKRMVTRNGRPIIPTVFYEWTDDDRISSLWNSEGLEIQFQHDIRSRLLSAQRENAQIQYRIPDIMGQTYHSPDRVELYGPNGELLEDMDATYEYTPAGFLNQKRLNHGAVYSYSFDGHGFLKAVICPDGKEVAFTYDPFGRRISKTVDGQPCFWLWAGDTPLHEISPKAPPLTWIWEPGTFTLLTKIQSGYIYPIITDHLGTPTQLYDESGSLGWQAQLDLFGDVVEVEEEFSTCHWRWPGQYEDVETGLYYNRFRYYDPQMGRYISPSPLGITCGLNVYGYTSDPMTLSWPLGIPSPPTDFMIHSSPLFIVPRALIPVD